MCVCVCVCVYLFIYSSSLGVWKKGEVKHCFCFGMPCGLQGLSFPPRGWIRAPCSGSMELQSLDHQGNSHHCSFFSRQSLLKSNKQGKKTITGEQMSFFDLWARRRVGTCGRCLESPILYLNYLRILELLTFLSSDPQHKWGKPCWMVDVCLHCEELFSAQTKVWVQGECILGVTLNLRYK